MKRIILAFVTTMLISGSITATVWNVGPSLTYTKPSQVVNLVNNGDTVYIAGGVYLNDACVWKKNNLKLIGLGTGANRTILRHILPIPNQKGIFLFELPGISDNPYVDNIVFDGAMISDASGGNAAGIRFQSVNITINNCKFMNCQNGILEGNGAVHTSNFILQNSEFENNGYQGTPSAAHIAGLEHHIYIGASTDTLVVTNCYFQRPRGQANSVKTRAQRNFILYNFIDENTGIGSWEICIAQGGLSVIIGNVIIQGTAGTNHNVVAYETIMNPLQDFYFINNTIINKYVGIVKLIYVTPTSGIGINTFKVYNNVFASVPGASNAWFNPNRPACLDSMSNRIFPNYLTAGFTNPAANDFSLLPTATSLINKGAPAGVANTGYSLLPNKMYKSNILSLLPRVTSGGIIDVGAYEFTAAGTVAVAAITVSSTGCVGKPIALTDASTGGPTSWTWNTAGGIPTASNTQNASVTYATAAVKTITLTVANASGTTTATKSITITATPVVATSITNTTICKGASTVVSVTGATSYAWLPSGSGSSTTLSPASTTIYTITGTMGGCTSAPKIVTINVTPNPTVTASASSTVICKGQTATLTAGGATSYVWSPAASLNNSTSSIVISSATTTTTYTVVGSISNCSSTKTVVLKVNTCTDIEDLTTPGEISVFPNPSNGLFTISNSVSIAKFEVVITNALGQNVITESGKNIQLISVDLSKQSKGIYFAKVTTPDGTKLFKLILD